MIVKPLMAAGGYRASWAYWPGQFDFLLPSQDLE